MCVLCLGYLGLYIFCCPFYSTRALCVRISRQKVTHTRARVNFYPIAVDLDTSHTHSPLRPPTTAPPPPSSSTHSIHTNTHSCPVCLLMFRSSSYATWVFCDRSFNRARVCASPPSSSPSSSLSSGANAYITYNVRVKVSRKERVAHQWSNLDDSGGG